MDRSHTNTAKHQKPPTRISTHHFHGSITQRHQSTEHIGNTSTIRKLHTHQNLSRRHRIQPGQLYYTWPNDTLPRTQTTSSYMLHRRDFFARNVDKARDFVNGGKATIEFYDEASKALVVLTESGHRIPVRPWTDQNLDNRTYHPIKPGYASTVLKLAGAELPHCVLWLDVPNVPGAACTGMSRVQYSKDLLIGGNLNADHFTPCQG